MAAPSGITWGSIVTKENNAGKIGIHTSLSNTNTQTTVTVQVWFASKYAVVDSNNTFYYDILSSSGSATTSKGSKSVKTTVSSGDGWSDTNEIKLATYTHTYNRGTSAATKYVYAKLTNIDVVGGAMSASKTVEIPKLPTYTVSYNANGGSGAPSAQTKTYGKTLTLSSTKPTRTGYSFQGWATSASGSVAYSAGGSYTTNASVTLYAVWKANTYKITYNANDGSGAPSAQTKTHAKTLTLSSTKPTRTGYSFEKWNTKEDGSGTSYSAGGSYTANAAATLYAIWKANTYKITYNANGGSGAPSEQTKTYGVTLTLSSTKPTRANYTFKGWATTSTATTAQYSAGGTFTTNAATTLYAVWELAYKNPTIKNATVARCNESGTSSASGTYIKVTFNWTTFASTPTVKIEWKAASSSTWSNTSVAATETSGSVSKIIGGGNLDVDSSYSVRITVDDGTESAVITKSVTGASKAISVLAMGKGIAFGKSAELTGYMDVAFKSRFRDSVAIDNQKCIYGINSAGEEVQILAPMNGNDNTVIGYGNYARATGNTNIYGYDVNIGVSNVGTSTTFRPYFRRGDSISVGYRGAGYVTDAGRQVVFIVPLAKPIVGSPEVVTVTSVNGFTLRQNNAYTHGSSATKYCTPDSYDASVIDGVGVYINAKFSTTTNVMNNAPIGIYWGGTITFS